MNSKLYIVVNKGLYDIHPGLVYAGIAHAAAAAVLKWLPRKRHHPCDEEEVQFEDWLQDSFKKVICIADQQELRKLCKRCEPHLVMTESSFQDTITCVVFHPMHFKDNALKRVKLLN